MIEVITLIDSAMTAVVSFFNLQLSILQTNTVKQNFVLLMPFVLSSIAIYVTRLQGQLNRMAWIIGLVSQFGWLSWSLVSGTYGFLPLNLVLFYQYWDNFRKWSAIQGEQA